MARQTSDSYPEWALVLNFTSVFQSAAAVGGWNIFANLRIAPTVMSGLKRSLNRIKIIY